MSTALWEGKPSISSKDCSNKGREQKATKAPSTVPYVKRTGKLFQISCPSISQQTWEKIKNILLKQKNEPWNLNQVNKPLKIMSVRKTEFSCT